MENDGNSNKTDKTSIFRVKLLLHIFIITKTPLASFYIMSTDYQKENFFS